MDQPITVGIVASANDIANLIITGHWVLQTVCVAFICKAIKT